MKNRLFSKTFLALGTLFGSSVLFATNSLVLYQNNTALVHEEKPLLVEAGQKQIYYRNISKNIDIDSLNVNLPKGVRLKAQHYEKNTLSFTKLLQNYLYQKVYLKTKNAHNTSPLTLLGIHNQKVILQDVKKRVFEADAKDVVLPQLPLGWELQPLLLWDVEVTRNIKDTITLEYLLKNISFKTNYTLKLTSARYATLDAWVNIQNNSGISFENVQLSFMAGDIRFDTSQPTPTPRYTKSLRSASAHNSPAASRESFEGYHLYTLNSKVSLKKAQNTQLRLFGLPAFEYTKTDSATLNNPLYLQKQTLSNATQSVRFKTDENILPAGSIYVYANTQNSTLLLGKTHIQNTPANTPLEVKLGKDFDLRITQTPLKRQEFKQNISATLRYTLANSSEEEKKVSLLIPFTPNAHSKIITKENYRFTKGNFATFTFTLDPQSTHTFEVTFERKY